MWEELGCYEGFALTWKAIYLKQGHEDECVEPFFDIYLNCLNTILSSRVMRHIKHLLDLIAQFPQSNPSATDPSDLDIPKLFAQIRSRYKVLCTTLGVRRSLKSAAEESPQSDIGFGQSEGGHRPTVWKLENHEKRQTSQGLNF
jgi:hypothetical protein